MLNDLGMDRERLDRIEGVAQVLLPLYEAGAPSVRALASLAVAALDAYDREHGVLRVPLEGATLQTVPEWEADLRERIATDIEDRCVRQGHTGRVRWEAGGKRLCRRCYAAARIARGGA